MNVKKTLARLTAPIAIAAAIAIGGATGAVATETWNYQYSNVQSNGQRVYHYQNTQGHWLVGIAYVGPSYSGTEQQMAEAIAQVYVEGLTQGDGQNTPPPPGQPSPGGPGGGGGGGGGGGTGGGGGGGGNPFPGGPPLPPGNVIVGPPETIQQ